MRFDEDVETFLEMWHLNAALSCLRAHIQQDDGFSSRDVLYENAVRPFKDGWLNEMDIVCGQTERMETAVQHLKMHAR